MGSLAETTSATSNVILSRGNENVKQEFSIAEDEAELDAEYERKMAEDDGKTKAKNEVSWEKVRQSLDDYNAAAKAEKEKRAEKASITTLKNRISKNEQIMRQLSDMVSMAKKTDYYSKAMAQDVENRKAIIQETLDIDRAALKVKQEAKKLEDKTRKEKKQEKELQQVKGKIAS